MLSEQHTNKFEQLYIPVAIRKQISQFNPVVSIAIFSNCGGDYDQRQHAKKIDRIYVKKTYIRYFINNLSLSRNTSWTSQNKGPSNRHDVPASFIDFQVD